MSNRYKQDSGMSTKSVGIYLGEKYSVVAQMGQPSPHGGISTNYKFK